MNFSNPLNYASVTSALHSISLLQVKFVTTTGYNKLGVTHSLRMTSDRVFIVNEPVGFPTASSFFRTCFLRPLLTPDVFMWFLQRSQLILELFEADIVLSNCPTPNQGSLTFIFPPCLLIVYELSQGRKCKFEQEIPFHFLARDSTMHSLQQTLLVAQEMSVSVLKEHLFSTTQHP